MSQVLPQNLTPLLKLWREWLAHSPRPALDRWLKRELAGQADALALGAAMHQGMRFLQLAAAMEYGYRSGREDIDWAAWDTEWQPLDADLPPLAFWYWVGLRMNWGDAQPQGYATPPGLRDAADRQAFFNRFAQGISIADEDVLNPAEALWYGIRPQWAPLLAARQRLSVWSQADLASFVRLQVVNPPLWLRPAPGQAPTTLVDELTAERVEVVLNDQGLCALGGADLTRTRAYREGRVEIQDLASQQLAAAVAATPGQKVWDACAGAGGKSLAIAAPMNNKGMLLATDLHAYKLDELKRRAKRAELFNIRTFTWTGDVPLLLPKEVARQAGFDWVLVDAPCSSSGTWRRNPDARWRFNATDSAELQALQAQLLTNAAPAVRLGGHLVYGSCSWQASENEDQVASFLARYPAFELVYQTCVGAPTLDSDTMFVAVLVRRK